LGLGLKEAKDMTDTAPVMVKEGMDKKGSDELREKLVAAGATVEVK
jgi:large subunit ribosomal protein L7/L12